MASKYWIFTINNPEESWTFPLTENECEYAIWQFERGASTGTRHVQGYVELRSRKRLGGVRTLVPGAHLEMRRGSRDQARDYCRKEESRIDGPFEFGSWSEKTPGRRTDLEGLMEGVRNGKSDLEIYEEMPESAARFYKFVERYRFLYQQRKNSGWRDVTTVVYVGAAGTGKTRKAFEEDPGLYKLDTGSTVWFDGYTGQRTLLIDDFYGWIQYGWLLNILDGYPLRLPIKGGHTWAAWTRVIITSNRDMHEWYKDGLTPALNRRISDVVRFM